MINQKMQALGSKHSVIRELFEYGNRRKLEIGAQNVFDFSLGNPSVPAPEVVTSTLGKLIGQVAPQELHAYTSASGSPKTKRAIADFVTSNYGFKADENLIYLTCGAAASLSISLNALVNFGDEVVVLAPFFPEYRVFAENSGATLKIVDANADFSLNLQGIGAAITPKTKAIIVNSPNNPSGAVISHAEALELAKLLEEKSREFGEPIYLISDEPYRELVYGKTQVPYLPALYGNTLVCYSFSKSLSLPGERIGYILVSPLAQDAAGIYNAVCGAGRALGYVCAPSLFQALVPYCLGQTANLEIYNQNRINLYGYLTQLGFEAVEPKGAFYLFVKAPNGNATDFCEAAKKEEILIVPSDDFGVLGYARISYCVSPDVIEGSKPAFERLAKRYFKG